MTAPKGRIRRMLVLNPFQHRKHNWAVAATRFPYKPGYGTYCKSCRTIVDTGLSYAEAMRARDELRLHHDKPPRSASTGVRART